MKKVEQAKLKFSRMKEIIKIGEINEKAVTIDTAEIQRIIRDY